MEDYRARFYETYSQEAEEYDRQFVKRYDEDLNTTLIFVSIEIECSDAPALTWITDWSVLRRDFCFHYRGQLKTPT